MVLSRKFFLIEDIFCALSPKIALLSKFQIIVENLEMGNVELHNSLY